MNKMSTTDIMQIFNFDEATDQLAKANCVRRYGYVLRKGKNNFIRRAL